MRCFGVGVWGMNLLSRLRSSKLASTILGDVVKVVRTLGGCFNQRTFNVSIIPDTLWFYSMYANK